MESRPRTATAPLLLTATLLCSHFCGSAHAAFGSVGAYAPTLNWHGIRDAALGPMPAPAPSHIWFSRSGVPTSGQPQGDPSSSGAPDTLLASASFYSCTHVGAVGPSKGRIGLFGAFMACPMGPGLDKSTCGTPMGSRGQDKPPQQSDTPVGAAALSDDFGATWTVARTDIRELLYAGPSYVTVEHAGRHVQCRIGGFPVTGDHEHGPNATASVACSADGVTWVTQAAPLPQARARAAATVYTFPGEPAPRIVLFGGVSSEASAWADPSVGTAVDDTLIASGPVDLSLPTAIGAGAGGMDSRVAGWAALPIPPLLRYRHLPFLGMWPGQVRPAQPDMPPPAALNTHPALVLGGGWDISASRRPVTLSKGITWVDDWWMVPDPRNASSWIPVLEHGPNDAIMSNPPDTHHEMPGPPPVIYLTGKSEGSSLGTSRQGLGVLMSFTPGGRSWMWVPRDDNTEDHQPLALVRASLATTPVYAQSAPALATGWGYVVTSALALEDYYHRDVIVTVFMDRLMRAFTMPCDHTCPRGHWSPQCGLDYASPICTPCTVCPGAGSTKPGPTNTAAYTNATYLVDACMSGSARFMNEDAQCAPCTRCYDGQIAVQPCTSTNDTVCGLPPPLKPYLPAPVSVAADGTVAMVRAAPTAAAVIAGIIVLVGLARHYGTSGAAVVDGQQVDAWGVGAASGAGVAGKGNAVAVTLGVGKAGAPVRGSSSDKERVLEKERDRERDVREYLAARQASIQRERARAAVCWSLATLVAVADATLAFLHVLCLAVFAGSLMSPQAEAEEAALSPALPAVYRSYGAWLLGILSAHGLLLVGRGAWILATHRLHLEGPQVTAWLTSGVNRAMLTLVMALQPLHSRLAALLATGNALSFPTPARLRTSLAILSPSSLLLLDLPALALVCGALNVSGFRAAEWVQPGVLPPLAYHTLLLTVTSFLVSAARLAWDVTLCVRSGGVYRLRHALAGMPAWRWLLLLLLPLPPAGYGYGKGGRFGEADADVVPRLAVAGPGVGSMAAGQGQGPGMSARPAPASSSPAVLLSAMSTAPAEEDRAVLSLNHAFGLRGPSLSLTPSISSTPPPLAPHGMVGFGQGGRQSSGDDSVTSSSSGGGGSGGGGMQQSLPASPLGHHQHQQGYLPVPLGSPTAAGAGPGGSGAGSGPLFTSSPLAGSGPASSGSRRARSRGPPGVLLCQPPRWPAEHQQLQALADSPVAGSAGALAQQDSGCTLMSGSGSAGGAGASSSGGSSDGGGGQ